MKYRIKNPQVEQAVRGLFITQEDFEKHFQLACHEYRADPMFVRLELIGDYAVTKAYCCATIDWKDIEKVVEYDSKVWNDYSKVKPPKKGWYRVEYQIEGENLERKCLFWFGSYWGLNEGVSNYGLMQNKFKSCRFKPWDDEEKEE